MNIVIVSRGYPTEEYKMQGIFEYDQAKALAAAGHQVIFAVLDLRSFRRKRKWGFDSFTQDGIHLEIMNIPCGNLPLFLINRLRVFALRKLYPHIKKKYGQPDVIHAHFLHFGYAAYQVFQHEQTPLVMTEHFSTMLQNKIPHPLMKLGHRTYKKVDQLLTVSQALSNNLQKQFGATSIVIPNIVDTKIFQHAHVHVDKNKFTFVTTARLIDWKKIDLLIEAFHLAFSHDKTVNLHIFGEGPERTKLEQMIMDFQLSDRVHLRGMVERVVISEQLSKSQCFVLASTRETFGVAFIEALAAGTPIIASACGGPDEYVNEHNGLLIPVDDLPALVQALTSMHQNIESYNRLHISQSIQVKFSSEVIAQKLTDVYADVIHKKKRSV